MFDRTATPTAFAAIINSPGDDGAGSGEAQLTL
jgi:hypothetical protein